MTHMARGEAGACVSCTGTAGVGRAGDTVMRIAGEVDAACLSSEHGELEDKLAHVQEQLAALQRAVKRLDELTVSARSADGLVHVEVGARGQLCRLHLDDAVPGQMSPSELAEVIIGLVRGAGADAAEQARDVMRSMVPGGVPEGREWWQWQPPPPGSSPDRAVG
jgi:DNA-binding protein YbaB